MTATLSGLARLRVFASLGVCFLAFLFLQPTPASAQTQQPFLFAQVQANGATSASVAVFTRDDATGLLSQVSNSPFALTTQGCGPTAIDAKARYLFGPCGDGASLYTFNSTTGAVAEVANSPFAISTGGTPYAVIGEATGQYVYAVRITPSTYPTPSSATLDTFQIDTTNNVLAPVPSQPSQTFTLPGTFLGIVTDPNHKFIQIYVATPNGSAPALGTSCGIVFD